MTGRPWTPPGRPPWVPPARIPWWAGVAAIAAVLYSIGRNPR